MASAVRLARRAVRRAGGRGRRARHVKSGAYRSILRHGAAQPRERRRPRGLRPPGRSLGRRHVRCARVPDVHVLGGKRLGTLERRGDAVRVRRRRPEHQRLRRLPGRQRRVRALRRRAADDRVGQEAGRHRRPLDRLRVSGTADGDSRRAAVGARALESQRRAGAAVHPDRGHRLRPERSQHRLLRRQRRASGDPGRRRAAAPRAVRNARALSERAPLQDGARPGQPARRREPLGAVRLGCARVRQPERDPQPGQRRDDCEQRPDPGGSGRAQPGARQRLREDLELPSAGGAARQGRAGEPVPAAGSSDRLVGVERDHRRLVRLRAGLVPRGRAGARLRDRDGAEPVPGHYVHA